VDSTSRPADHDRATDSVAETIRGEAEERALQAAKLRALGQMASGIAHDLNQALGLVVGHGELALRQLDAVGGPADAARDSLRVMVKAALDGAETVKRLLVFSRAQPEGEPQPVDVGALLSDAAKLTAPRWRDAAQAEGRPIVLTVESEGDTRVSGWAASLREAVANLVFNAVDALPDGGSIRLVARPVRSEAAGRVPGTGYPLAGGVGRGSDGLQVEVLVVDDGVGMPPEVRARVFEPFFTTKGEKGTGLGLAMVLDVVDRHGGRISVESAQAHGRGTTFRLLLPAAGRAEGPTGPPTAPSVAAPRLRILAVDDEPELRDMIALMLGNDGHAVRTAGSGDEALAVLEVDEFDMVLSDVGMSGMNGWELVERVRGRWPSLRLVLATGWGAEIDPARARQQGVEAVIAKPFRFSDLRRVLSGG
jgi:signal transduction histidine kinase/CheY-like chemotaxis protein